MSVIGAVANLPAEALSFLSPHAKKNAAGANSINGVNGAKPAVAGSPAASGTAAASTDIGSTFLNLLVKELQNQDPTAPMDSTAMVGQMISLNQLDQLIAINQAVNPPSTSTSGSGATPQAFGATGSSASAVAARNALVAALSPTQAAAQGRQPPTPGTQPLTPGTQLPPPGALSANGAFNAAPASANSAGVLNLSNFNSLFGGK